MGNGSSDGTTPDPSTYRGFPMQKYVAQGAKPQQVLKIKEAFDSYHPVDGQIEVSRLRSTTEQSGSKKVIDRYLQGKQKMNFDEFFTMSKQLVEQQIKNNPGLIVDASEVQATCLFCPYAEDRPVS